jgi:hypothetical protein
VKKRAAVIFEDVEDRHLCDLVPRLDLTEGRRLLHAQPYPQADADQQHGDQERNAPSPRHEFALRQLRHQREHADRRQVPMGLPT